MDIHQLKYLWFDQAGILPASAAGKPLAEENLDDTAKVTAKPRILETSQQIYAIKIEWNLKQINGMVEAKI